MRTHTQHTHTELTQTHDVMVCVNVYNYIHLYRRCMCAHISVHIAIHSCMNMQVFYIYTHVCIYIYIHMCVCIYMHIFPHPPDSARLADASDVQHLLGALQCGVHLSGRHLPNVAGSTCGLISMRWLLRLRART